MLDDMMDLGNSDMLALSPYDRHVLRVLLRCVMQIAMCCVIVRTCNV